jgi:hypothetical protein
MYGIIGSKRYSDIFAIEKQIAVPTAKVIILFLMSTAVSVVAERIKRIFTRKAGRIIYQPPENSAPFIFKEINTGIPMFRVTMISADNPYTISFEIRISLRV